MKEYLIFICVHMIETTYLKSVLVLKNKSDNNFQEKECQNMPLLWENWVQYDSYIGNMSY